MNDVTVTEGDPGAAGPNIVFTVTRLNDALVSGGEVDSFFAPDPDFLISPDGATVVYAANQDSVDVTELYAVPIAGGVPVKLSGAVPCRARPDGPPRPGRRLLSGPRARRSR